MIRLRGIMEKKTVVCIEICLSWYKMSSRCVTYTLAVE